MKNPITIKFADKRQYNEFYKAFKSKLVPSLEYYREEAEEDFIRARDESSISYLTFDLGKNGKIFMDYMLNNPKDSYKTLETAEFNQISFETQKVPEEIQDRLEDFVLKYYNADNFKELEENPAYQL